MKYFNTNLFYEYIEKNRLIITTIFLLCGHICIRIINTRK